IWIKDYIGSPQRSLDFKCPLYPQKRTYGVQHSMSAMGQKRTYDVQKRTSNPPLAPKVGCSGVRGSLSALPFKADRMGNEILCSVNRYPRASAAPALSRAADSRQQAAAVMIPATG